MIQYSNINDAWGNKEIFKKNILNNLDSIGKPVAQISPNNAVSPQDTLLAPVETKNAIPQVDKNIVVPITAQNIQGAPILNNIDIASNTPVKNPSRPVDLPVNPVPKNIIDVPIISNQQINKNEHFSSCSFAEHLKNCEHCRNTLAEHFSNTNKSHINLLGLEFDISKDILKVIFIILIVAIFIILLSLVNFPIQDDLNIGLKPAQLKYLMMNHMPYNYYQ
jgi:hypothetical protein